MTCGYECVLIARGATSHDLTVRRVVRSVALRPASSPHDVPAASSTAPSGRHCMHTWHTTPNSKLNHRKSATAKSAHRTYHTTHSTQAHTHTAHTIQHIPMSLVAAARPRSSLGPSPLAMRGAVRACAGEYGGWSVWQTTVL